MTIYSCHTPTQNLYLAAVQLVEAYESGVGMIAAVEGLKGCIGNCNEAIKKADKFRPLALDHLDLSEDLEIDDIAHISDSSKGFFVQTWSWIPFTNGEEDE